MSRPSFSAAGFMIGFCCVYACVFAMNRPLFLYYPMHGDLTWGNQVLKGAGPAMAWYGLMANAAIGGTVVALIVPDRLVDAVLRNYLWFFPCVAMVTCVFLLRRFFLS